MHRADRSPLVPTQLLALVALAAVLLPPGSAAQTHPLNDTGQIICYNASASTGTVSPADPDPEAAGFNRQDCTQGRAAADAVGVLYKVGGSTRPGADYTRIANDGSELPVNATLGSGPGDWACTRDNLTGLIWEIKVDDAANLRHQGHGYTWYDTDGAVNGGNDGTLGTDATCNATLTNCNSTAFRNAVNAAGLCGASDWRLPTADELQSLLHYGVASGSSFDNTWFPNTSASSYWAGQNFAPDASGAWIVSFADGQVQNSSKNTVRPVRLVRGVQ